VTTQSIIAYGVFGRSKPSHFDKAFATRLVARSTHSVDDCLNALCVNHRVVRPHAAIYRLVNIYRPRVYRDEKRVCHDDLNGQWNLSDLRLSIRFSNFRIDGADCFKDNSKNLFDVDIPASDLRFDQLWLVEACRVFVTAACR
jgi:hypothetical protein